jgi:hypothetical protein
MCSPDKLRSFFLVDVWIHGRFRKILFRDEADDLHPLGEELAVDQLHRKDVLSQREEDLQDRLPDFGQLQTAITQTSKMIFMKFHLKNFKI